MVFHLNYTIFAENKANEIRQKQSYQKVASFMKKMGKKTIEKYQGLSKKGKIVLWSALIAALPTVKIGTAIHHKIQEHKEKVEQKNLAQSKIQKLTEKHKISDREKKNIIF